MDFIPLAVEHYSAWDAFCQESRDAWFFHKREWIDYNLAYRPELKGRSLSFLCREGSQILAVVPLILEQHERDGKVYAEFSFGGFPCPTPALASSLNGDLAETVLAGVFEMIEELAQEFGVVRASFRFDALLPRALKPVHSPSNFLLKYRFLECGWSTQMIDLRPSEAELWDGIRRNHQRNIEKARESLSIRFHAGAELTDAKFEEYRLMHARAAGRVTRPLETFHYMRDWIKRGESLLVEAVHEGKTVGFELYLIYKNGVYGGSACNELGYERLALRHLVEWEAMLWMKKRGLEFYEIGIQYFGALPYHVADEKNVAISHFKAGFGGVLVPFYAAERFYSRDYWEAVQRGRERDFAAAYPWSPAVGGRYRELFLKRLEGAGKTKTFAASDVTAELAALVAAVLSENPKAVKSYLEGDAKSANFLVGLTRKRCGADPQLVKLAIETAMSKTVKP